MHTFQRDNVIIQHNGDYLGYAYLRVDDTEIQIPCKTLVAFARQALCDELLAVIEKAAR